MKTYTFRVSLPGHGRVWRKIEMRADQTLEDLHFAIQEAYGWGADHLYSFFMSGRAWDGESEYCLPEGCDPWGMPIEEPFEGEVSPELLAEEAASGPGDVRETAVGEFGLEVGQGFMYLFDYGDEWRFKVRVHAINPEAPEAEYPRIVEVVGEAPEQYPLWDDE